MILPMQKTSKILLALLAAASLVAVPLAMAAPGGKGRDHADERASGGLDAAESKRGPRDGGRDRHDGTDDDGPRHGLNGTMPRDGHAAKNESAAKPPKAPKAPKLPPAPRDGNESAENHTGLHKGWTKIQAKMPEKFRAWWALVLRGVGAREAKAAA